MRTKEWFERKSRRIDLALAEAIEAALKRGVTSVKFVHIKGVGSFKVSKEENKKAAKVSSPAKKISPAKPATKAKKPSPKKVLAKEKPAARNFSPNQHQLHQLVILVTAGRQVSDAQSKDDNHKLLMSASKALSSQNIKVIILPVGLETDFKELGLIVKRPQSLYPFSGFDAMTPPEAQKVAENILKTLGKIFL